MTDLNDLSRYSRQLLFRPIGIEGQKRLLKSRVAIVGLGALGTVLANHMVRAGVGFVRLIDRDFVEASNLQRQMLYDERDAQEAVPKAEAAKRKLQEINSGVTIESHVTDLTWRNAEKLLRDMDLILDGTDNFQVRFLLNDVAVKHRIPWVYGGGVSAEGVTASILPDQTPCLRCLLPAPPPAGSLPTCDTAGVIGPLIHIVASLQAVEAYKILLGDIEKLRGDMLQLSLWEHQFHSIGLKKAKNTNCTCCGHRNFEFLEPQADDETLSLCGRDTIQITPHWDAEGIIDLTRLAERLTPLGQVELTKFFLRVLIDEIKMTIFPDGRTLLQGTSDPAVAKNHYAKYVGI